MNKVAKAANVIFEAIMLMPDDYERWRTLVYKYNKFTMQFPLVALYMSKGHYNEKAFISFMKKVQQSKKDEMTKEEFNELHAHYAKYYYMECADHYDATKFGMIISSATETLNDLFRDKQPDINQNAELTREIIDEFIADNPTSQKMN